MPGIGASLAWEGFKIPEKLSSPTPKFQIAVTKTVCSHNRAKVNQGRGTRYASLGSYTSLSIANITPDTFYGVEEDPALHNVDVMTDISMAGTAFTRYTAAPSNVSKTSKYAAFFGAYLLIPIL